MAYSDRLPTHAILDALQVQIRMVPIVRNALYAYLQGDVNIDQCLIAAIKGLVAANEQLQRDLLQALEASTVRISLNRPPPREHP